MTTWIISANVKYYDIFKAYANLKAIDWRLRYTPEVGDIVYIYVSHPYRCVKFKTRVTAINVPPAESIKDEEFYINKQDTKPNVKLFTRLELLETYSHSKCDREYLHANGVLGNIQSPRRLSAESVEAFNKVLSNN